MCQVVTLHANFFFKDTATTEIYTLSLHDALPICIAGRKGLIPEASTTGGRGCGGRTRSFLLLEDQTWHRSEEHTSELHSHLNLVCRLPLSKKTHCHDHYCRSPATPHPIADLHTAL